MNRPRGCVYGDSLATICGIFWIGVIVISILLRLPGWLLFEAGRHALGIALTLAILAIARRGFWIVAGLTRRIRP